MKRRENNFVFFDGEFVLSQEVKLDLFSQTLHYGNGVFEGIRAYETSDGIQLFKAKDHFDRLAYSASRMHINLNYSSWELTEISQQLLEKNQLRNAYVRPLVYTAPNMNMSRTEEAHLLLTAWSWNNPPMDKLLDVMISSFQRPNPESFIVDAKICGHYVNSILASSEAKSKGFHDAILLDHEGFASSATNSNIFLEKDDVLFTPPEGAILPGITRQTVMELALEIGIEVREKKILPEDFWEADGAFLAGTSSEITGLASVDRMPFYLNWEDTLGYVISRKYQQLVTQSDSYHCTII